MGWLKGYHKRGVIRYHKLFSLRYYKFFPGVMFVTPPCIRFRSLAQTNSRLGTTSTPNIGSSENIKSLYEQRGRTERPSSSSSKAPKSSTGAIKPKQTTTSLVRQKVFWKKCADLWDPTIQVLLIILSLFIRTKIFLPKLAVFC